MIKLSQLLKISLLAIEQTEVFTRRDPDLARTLGLDRALEDILMTINTPQDRIIYDVGRHKGENEEVIR